MICLSALLETPVELLPQHRVLDLQVVTGLLGELIAQRRHRALNDLLPRLLPQGLAHGLDISPPAANFCSSLIR